MDVIWRRTKNLMALLFFGALAALLYSRFRDMDWTQVWLSVRALEAGALLNGLAFTALAYLAFAGYDLLSRRHLQHRVPVVRVTAIALVAYALNLNLGALIGGWASRLRLYSKAGLNAATTTQIIGLGVLTNWTGYLLIAGLVFTCLKPELPDSWGPSSATLPVIGIALLILLSLYLLLCATKSGQELTLRSFILRIPSLRFAMLQLGIALVHWLSMAMVLRALLPEGLPLPTIVAVLLMASIAGAATHVPGGLGVIEAVFVGALGERLPPAQLIGSLFAFRATFYLTPLFLALVTYPFLERVRLRCTESGKAASPRLIKA